MDFLRNYFVVLLALILVFVLNVSFTLGDYNINLNYDIPEYKILKATDAKLYLECNATNPLDTTSSSKPTLKWFKNSTLIRSSPDVDVSDGKLTLKKPTWNDVGNYTCELTPPNSNTVAQWAHIYVIAKPYVKIHPNQLIFIEGEELKIECVIYGRPTPNIIWSFENGTLYEKSKDRVTITVEKGVDENSIKSYFKIDHAKMSDRGEYSCLAQNEANYGKDEMDSKATCYVRIKDKYAALWPFLGICVEVVVLCAVIFIYEKKRNKAELEESDTDQSPEQLGHVGASRNPSASTIIIPLESSTVSVNSQGEINTAMSNHEDPMSQSNEKRHTPFRAVQRTVGVTKRENTKVVTVIETPAAETPFSKEILLSSPEFFITLPVQHSPTKIEVNKFEQEAEEKVLQVVDCTYHFQPI